MKVKALLLVGLILGCLGLTGCETTGLSLREQGENNYSNIIYGLSSQASSPRLTRLKDPFRLAVVQVGEQSPHPAMMRAIRESDLPVTDLIPLPAAGLQISGADKRSDIEAYVQKKVASMLSLARSQGADYVFLFGGSADIGQKNNALQILDLTIIGGFLIDSNTVFADGKAVGALVDVDTGSVVFLVSADQSASGGYPSFNFGARDEILGKFRQDLVQALGGEFIKRTGLYL